MESLGPNDAPIQSSMISGVIDGLYQERDLFYALQFSSLAEQLVLRDRLVVVRSDDSNDQTSAEDDADSMADEVLDTWAADGAIFYQSISDTALHDSRRSDPFAIDSNRMDETKPANVRAAEEDPIAAMMVAAMDSLYTERLVGRASAVLPLQLIFYEMSANVRADHSVCDLTGRYANLAATLVALRKGVQANATPYVSVPLPPIGYEVFRRAHSLEDLFEKVLQVRDEFADLRERLRGLADILDDPTVALKDKLRQRAKWQVAWKSVEGKYTFAGEMKVASTTQAIYKLAPDVPGAIGLSPSSWLSLLTKIQEQIPDMWQRWRFRALHKTLDAYLDAPDANLGSAIGKVVGRDIDNSEAVELEDFLSVAKELRNAAVLVAVKSE